MENKATITAWLFTPFKYIAGGKALIYGLLVMLLLSVLGYYSNTHFDGALDIHYRCLQDGTPYIIHALYQLISWYSLTIVFFIVAKLATKSDIRFIDIAGTFALAQAPLVFAALLGFIPSFHVCLGDINTLSIGEMTAILKDNMLMLVICGISAILFSIWSIILKYNAYSVSANIKGITGGVSFAIGLILAEIMSKVLIYCVLLIV